MVRDGRAPNQRTVYRIEVKGILDESWSDWFDGTMVGLEYAADGTPITTLIVTAIDQARLRGILSRIWDLNLSVVSVKRIDTESHDPHAQQGGA